VPEKKPLQIANLLANSTIQQALRRANVLKRLDRLVKQSVNPTLRDHCHVVGIIKNSLVVNTDSPAWATRLRYQQQHILSSLHKNEELCFLTAISIQVTAPTGNQFPTKRKALAPSPEAAAQMSELCATIHDTKLQRTLQRIALRGNKKP